MNRIRHSFRNALRHLVVLSAGLMIVLVPGFAFADDDPFDRPGFYVGLGGVYQTNPFENRIEDLVSDAVEDELPGSDVGLSIGDSGGLNALVGYRLASFFAAELQYEWVDEYRFKITESTTNQSAKLYSISGNTLTANTKWIVPFWRVQPFLLIGVGVSVADVDRGSIFDNAILGPVLDDADIEVKDGRETNFAGRAGLGLDVYVTENIVVTAQGQTVLSTLKKPDLGDIDDLNYLGFSAGLQYRF